VVLSPRRGLLLLEVKDWWPGTLTSATRDAVELNTDRGRVVQAHLLRQARDYALELVDLMSRHRARVPSSGPHRGMLLFFRGFVWGLPEAMGGDVEAAAQ